MFEKMVSLKVLKWVVAASVLLISSVTLWIWLDPNAVDILGVKTELMNRYGGIAVLTNSERALGLAIDAVPAAFLVAALVFLYRLLGLIEQGRWHEEAAERYCTAVGRSMLLYIGASIVNHTALVLLFTFSRPEGQRELAIGISSDNFLGLIPALMAFVIGQLMRLARQQREELDEIV